MYDEDSGRIEAGALKKELRPLFSVVLDLYDIKNKRAVPSSSYDAIVCLLTSSSSSNDTGSSPHLNAGTLHNDMCVRALKMAAIDKKDVIMVKSIGFQEDATALERAVGVSDDGVKRTLQGFFQTKAVSFIATYASHAAANIYAEIAADETNTSMDDLTGRDDVPRHLSCCGLQFRGYLGYERVSGQGIAGRLYQSVKQSYRLHMEFEGKFNLALRKERIASSHKFLFIISEQTFASAHCLQEFMFALEEGKDIILIRDINFTDTSDPREGAVNDLIRMHGDTRPWKIRSVAEKAGGVKEYDIECLEDAGLTNMVKSSNFLALCNTVDGSKMKAKGWDFYVIGNPPPIRELVKDGILNEKDIIRVMRYV